uniref:DUF8039 domain-containing protein n=1 Tax=Fagus sylvatica TaxID=28930 RepID=A0A2N9I3B2_FAGSY
MASSSSQNNHDAINLNVVPSATLEVWRPYLLSSNDPVTVTNFVMLSDTTATAVAASLLTPEDGRVLAERTDPQTINDSMALTIQCVASVSNMGRRLHVRNHEVRALRSQVTILQRLLKDNKKKVGELKEENKGLKKLVDSYANDLVAWSTEQNKTTIELQKQYEKLLVEENLMLTLLIPGPKQPGNDIDVYLEPLVEDLNELWSNGVNVYDAFSKSMFNLKAMLMWTINDFPAYGNLSGYSTKGKVACPVCHAETCSKYLNHSKKLVYMGHRRFLAPNHRYRKKASWFDGNEENRRKPKIVTGEEVFLEVKDLRIERICFESCTTPKGCIAECYLTSECLKFCSGYMKQAAEIGARHTRNEDFENETILEGRPISGGKDIRVPDNMLEIAHRYVILNSAEVEPYIEMHMKELRNLDIRLLKNETLLQKRHKATFSAWESDTSNWYVVLKAPPRSFDELEMFDESTYMSSTPLDLSRLDLSVDDEDECYVAKNISKKAKAQRTAAILSKVQQVNERVRISSEGSNSPLTPSPDIQAIPESSNVNAKIPKKTRGPNKLKGYVSSQSPRLELRHNGRGQVVGTNSDKFSTHLGCLVREHVPVVIKNWTKVDSRTRDDLWTLVQVKSDKFSAMRKKQQLLHTMSRKGYARLENEMISVSETPLAVTRVDVWTQGHLKKNGEPINKAVDETLVVTNHTLQKKKKIQDCTQSSTAQPVGNTIKDDAIAQVVGPGRRGYVIGLGFGATPSQILAEKRGNEMVRQLQSQLKEQANGMKNLEAQIEKLTAMVSSQSQQGMSTPFDSQSNTPIETPHTSQSQQGSDAIFSDANLENAQCELLNWCLFEKEEVIAKGKIATTDPYSKVHHVPLGNDCWKDWVDEVKDSNVPLYRSTSEFSSLNEAVGSTVAWPKKFIKLL